LKVQVETIEDKLEDADEIKQETETLWHELQVLQSDAPYGMLEALLGTRNDKGKMGQVLHKGTENAVLASYETTRAFS
jgi:hypothetical protein